MRLLQTLNDYSIDVAIGAMVSACAFAVILEVHLTYYTVVLLGLTVWIIYTFDHLEDARSLKQKALTNRHKLHQQHYKTLSVLLIIALVGASILVFLIPKITLVWGASLFCLVGVYFVGLRLLKSRFSHFKEFTIAIVYTLGVALGPMSIFNGHLMPTHYLLLLQFILIAFTNLILFSRFEESIDKSHQFPSLAQVIGPKKLNLVIGLSLVFQLLCAVLIWLVSGHFLIPVIFLCMGSVLALMFIYERLFKPNYFYRVIGDGVFLIPAILLLT